jgi:hypothetical protein
MDRQRLTGANTRARTVTLYPGTSIPGSWIYPGPLQHPVTRPCPQVFAPDRVRNRRRKIAGYFPLFPRPDGAKPMARRGRSKSKHPPEKIPAANAAWLSIS